jgi:hypothetical protein
MFMLMMLRLLRLAPSKALPPGDLVSGKRQSFLLDSRETWDFLAGSPLPISRRLCAAKCLPRQRHAMARASDKRWLRLPSSRYTPRRHEENIVLFVGIMKLQHMHQHACIPFDLTWQRQRRPLDKHAH